MGVFILTEPNGGQDEKERSLGINVLRVSKPVVPDDSGELVPKIREALEVTMGQVTPRWGSDPSPVPLRLTKAPAAGHPLPKGEVKDPHVSAARVFKRAAPLLLGSLILCLFCVVQSGVLVAIGPGQESPSRTHHDADVPTLLRTAQDALGRNDFATVVDALKHVVEAQPTLTAAWFNLAYAYTGLHKYEEAVASYRKTLDLDPNLFEARLNLGILLIQLKNPQAALEHLEKAATLKPDYLRAQLYYGRALALTGQTERAEKQYQTVLQLDPSLASAHYDLGQLYLQQKRYQEALGSFQKASERDPALSQAQLGMALAMEGLKDEANAVGRFEQYLASHPDDLETRFHLARLYLELGKNQQAYEGLQSVHRLKPETHGLAAALGDVCALLKKFPEAEKFYREALLAIPAYPDLHRALGRTLLEEEKLSEAEVEFRTALKSDPRSRDAAQGLATCLYRQKRYPEAIPLLEALTSAPNPPAILVFALATCYDNLHALKKALGNYERFLQLSKGQSPDHEWQATQRAKLLRHQLEK
jgi:tetratricopeptide (TPR) repeat protein